MQSSEEYANIEQTKKSIIGYINVGLLFKPDQDCSSIKGNGSLIIFIRQVKEISPSGSCELGKFVTKSYLLPNRGASGKTKTRLLTNDVSRILEEKITFRNIVFLDLLESYILEIILEDERKKIGGIRFGSHPGNFSQHNAWNHLMEWESPHWEEMLNHPGKCIEGWHALRLPLPTKNVDMSKEPLSFKEQLYLPDAHRHAASAKVDAFIPKQIAYKRKEEDSKKTVKVFLITN